MTLQVKNLLKKEEISFTLHYKDDKYPEKEVKIYRYDGTNCLVTIDGKSISLVKKRSGRRFDGSSECNCVEVNVRIP